MRDDDTGLHNVVAFGGSAGSLPIILKQVRRLMRRNHSCLFVVYHRAGTVPFDLNRFLDRDSAFLAVPAAEGLPVEPNHVYFPYLSENLEVSRGRLHITRPHARPHPNIDILFSSLSRAYGERTIGVLLSGLGRDGVKGLDAIQAAGGTTIVQAPEYCQFPDLPLAALDAGVANHVLPTDDLVSLVERILNGDETAVKRISRSM